MKRLLLAVLLVAGCGAAAPTPTPLALTGTFALHFSDHWASTSPSECHGIGGYDDFLPGMPVVVKDQAGTVIATAATVFDAIEPAGNCRLKFAVSPLPDVAFYSVEIGHRGAVTYSKADLVAKGWKLDLTLGA